MRRIQLTIVHLTFATAASLALATPSSAQVVRTQGDITGQVPEGKLYFYSASDGYCSGTFYSTTLPDGSAAIYVGYNYMGGYCYGGANGYAPMSAVRVMGNKMLVNFDPADLVNGSSYGCHYDANWNYYGVPAPWIGTFEIPLAESFRGSFGGRVVDGRATETTYSYCYNGTTYRCSTLTTTTVGHLESEPASFNGTMGLLQIFAPSPERMPNGFSATWTVRSGNSSFVQISETPP